jgi:hypothetical protein
MEQSWMALTSLSWLPDKFNDISVLFPDIDFIKAAKGWFYK